jgi:hypothetical protein
MLRNPECHSQAAVGWEVGKFPGGGFIIATISAAKQRRRGRGIRRNGIAPRPKEEEAGSWAEGKLPASQTSHGKD